MALGRLEAKVISRGSGHSAVAKSAYNSREALFAERYDKREDYSRKDDCLFSGFYAPKDAPDWAQDRGRFWNAVEWREKRKDAQLGREFEIAIPHELDTEQARRLLQDFVRENFVRKGYAADVAIHRPRADSDERNIHAHVFVPLRRIEDGHWAEKKDRPSKIERAAELKELRSDWEKRANKALQRYGFEARIDMRSYAERGLDREPGVHLGKEAAGLERRGVETELGNRNREAANENRRRAANNDRQPTEAEIEQARELADAVLQQRAGFRQQDEERANTTWDAADGSTLSNMRQREREAGPSRSTENEARRALDDLARTDPHGTARNFGHHAGDRLKSPEDMRREQADRLRGFDVQPEPVRTKSPEDMRREQAERLRSFAAEPGSPKHQAEQPSPMAERAAWAANLRSLAQEAPQEAHRAAQDRPGPFMLRTALAAAMARLAGMAGRLEAAYSAITARSRVREQEAAQSARPRIEAEPTPMQTRTKDTTVNSVAREDTSSRKVNRDFAEDLLQDARAELARQAAIERAQVRDHDRVQRETTEREAERMRELLRQDRQARKPHEPT